MQVLTISSSNGNKIYYNRDLNKRVVQEVNFWSTLSYSANMDYDLNGNRTRATISSSYFTAYVSGGGGGLTKLNDISYNYDANNRLTSMSNFLGDNFSFNYDQSNRLTSVVRPGSRTDYTFSGPMLSSIIHSSGAATKSFNQYTYDNRNLITQKRNTAGIFDYSYDQDGQLIGTNQSQPTGNPESFSYDEIGNRLSTGQFVQTYDSTSQRIQDDGVFTYTFDKTGNIISKNSKSGGQSYIFQYSSRNQLTQALIYDSPLGKRIKAISYNYDPVGRRIAKFVNTYSDGGQFATSSFAKKYAYDGENIVAELDSDNKILARYTHSPLSADDLLAVNFTNHAVAAVNGGDALSNDYVLSNKVGSFYYLKDNLNSVTDIVDGSGSIIQRYDYYSFGTIRSIKDSAGSIVDLSSAPIKTSFTFTGREFEPETGLYYYRARYYDPNTGRFLQKDPDPGKLADPRTFLSKYVYVANSPAMFSDSSGKFWWIIAIAVATGIFQGINNVNAAKEAGYGGDKLLQTFFVGFVSGALQGAVAAVAGPWWGLAAAFAGGVVNNSGNQRIFNPSSNGIDLGQAFKSGGYSAAGFALGAGLGYAAGGTLGLNVGGGFGSADAATGVVGLIGSHIPGNAAPNGISRCQDSLNCLWYNPSTGERK